MSPEKRENQDRSAETRAKASGMSAKPRFEDCCDPRELLDLTGRKGLEIGIANERSLAWPGGDACRVRTGRVHRPSGRQREEDRKARIAPLRRNIETNDVGLAALLLASDYTAAITGETLHVDAGVHIEGPVGRGQMQGETKPREQEK